MMKSLLTIIILFGINLSQAHSCADFSGDWVGVCEKDNGTAPTNVKMTVVQKGCENIDFGSGPTAIGKISDIVFSSPSFDSIHASNYFAWTKDKMALDRRVTLIATNSSNGNIYTEMAVGVWRIENNTFVADQKWYERTLINGEDKETIVRSICTHHISR